MRFYDSSFFNDDEGPKVSISPDGNWCTLRITDTGRYFTTPSLTFHLRSEAQFIQFKNSVIQAYELYRRKKNAS